MSNVIQFPDRAPRVAGVAPRSQHIVEQLAGGEITVEDAFLLASDLLNALRCLELPGGDPSGRWAYLEAISRPRAWE